ncbi:MAG: glycosyltransferase family 4 protein [Gemmatimonadota bacterium]
MRILQICQRPQRRGAEVFTHQLGAELRRQGHEVAIVYLYPHEGPGALPVGSQDRLLDGDEHHPLETLIGFRPALLRKVAEAIEKFRPDATQLNGARAVKYGVLSRRIMRASVGSLVYRNIGVPQRWIRGPRRRGFYRLISRDIDGVAAITRGSLTALRELFPEPIPLTVISNAVDEASLRPRLERSSLRDRASTPQGAPVVLFVGALSPEKRVDRLIDAVAEVRKAGADLHLWIVGGGSLRDRLEDQVEGLQLGESVRFFGPQEDVASFYAAADLLALVSETEGIPAVLLEAGLLGLPVVATRVGGIPECVADEETGLLVDEDDPAALVHALRRLTGDSGLRARLGSQARERVRAHHSIGSLTQEFLDFYRRVGGSTLPAGTGARGPGRR